MTDPTIYGAATGSTIWHVFPSAPALLDHNVALCGEILRVVRSSVRDKRHVCWECQERLKTKANASIQNSP